MNKSVIIGFLLGAAANILGVVLAALILGSGTDVVYTLKAAIDQNFIGKLISLGAALNLFLFFFFIRKRRDDQAKGVLFFTIFAALGTFLLML